MPIFLAEIHTSVLYTLLVCIPLGYINAVAGCKLDAVACVYDTHTDGNVLHDWNSVLFAAFRCKNDVSFDVHDWVYLKFCTQIYTQKLK